MKIHYKNQNGVENVCLNLPERCLVNSAVCSKCPYFMGRYEGENAIECAYNANVLILPRLNVCDGGRSYWWGRGDTRFYFQHKNNKFYATYTDTFWGANDSAWFDSVWECLDWANIILNEGEGYLTMTAKSLYHFLIDIFPECVFEPSETQQGGVSLDWLMPNAGLIWRGSPIQKAVNEQFAFLKSHATNPESEYFSRLQEVNFGHFYEFQQKMIAEADVKNGKASLH